MYCFDSLSRMHTCTHIGLTRRVEKKNARRLVQFKMVFVNALGKAHMHSTLSEVSPTSPVALKLSLIHISEPTRLA